MLVLYICLKVVFEEDSAEILNCVIGERLRDISMLDNDIQTRELIQHTTKGSNSNMKIFASFLTGGFS